MEIQARWFQLLESFAHLRRLVRQFVPNFALMGALESETKLDAT